MGPRNEATSWGSVLASLALAAAIVTFLALKFSLLSTININWDEFLYLSEVHQFDRGELTSAFQTFHVNLFHWLVGFSGTGHEIDEMMVARRAMYALRIGTTLLVGLLGYRVAGRTGGLIAALASLTFSFVLRHGESFRADPLIAFLFLVTAVLLAWRPASAAGLIAAAAAFALAATISAKAAIYVPAIIAIAGAVYWTAPEGGSERRGLLQSGLIFVAAGVATFTTLQLLHASQLAASSTAAIEHAAASGAGMLGNPQIEVLSESLRHDWPFWLLLAAGGMIGIIDAGRSTAEPDARRRAWVVLSLLLPLASLALYRNTFPYFYVAIVPLGSVACGYAVARVERQLTPGWRPAVAVLVAVPLVIQGWRFASPLRRDAIAPQRAVVEAVHRIFPKPVTYIDRGGMIASFPRVPLFMSTYVLSRYRERGVPLMQRLVAERQPSFLLANVSGLALGVGWQTARATTHRLLREDFLFLQDNFVHHWGPIWVPGKRVALQGKEVALRVVVGGTYTVESRSAVTVDGVSEQPGALVELAPGDHRVNGSGLLILRFGARLLRPSSDPPWQALFHPL